MNPARMRLLALLPLFWGTAAAEPAPPIAPELLARIPPELRYTRVSLPDEQNAFIPWSQAAARYVKLTDEDGQAAHAAMLLEGNGFQATAGGERDLEWLKANEEALALVEAGIRRGRCQFPEVTGPQAAWPYLMPLKRFAEMKLVRTKLQASLANYDAAVSELADVFRMGELMSRGDGLLIDYWVGVTIQGWGAEGGRWLAAQPGVPEKALARLVSEATPPKGGDGLAQALRAEVPAMLLPVTSRLAAADPKSASPLERLAADRALFDPIATLDLAVGLYARTLRCAEASWVKRDPGIERDLADLAKAVPGGLDLLPLYHQWCEGHKTGVGTAVASDPDVETIRATLAAARDAAGKPVSNPLGKALFSSGTTTIYHIVEVRANCLADREAARTMAALRVYKLRKGQLPESLQGLVDEKILPAAPMDPFSDKPLFYSKTKRLVWSVGKNETDEGGSGNPADRFAGNDYVWPVPPP